MNERRRFERQSSAIRVEIMHPAIGKIIGSARDISDGGASVLIEHATVPPVGTVVDVCFKKMAGAINVDPVKMQIMHQDRNVVGLMFCA